VINRIFNIAAIFSIASLVAIGGFAGYLVAAGRVNAARLDKLAAVLRGELDGDHGAEASAEATSQPVATSRPASGQTLAELQRSQARDQVRRALLERAGADAEARQQLVDQALQELLALREEFERRKAAWEEERAKLTSELQDAGFQRELEYFGSLSPKLAKEHLLLTWQKHKADAVRLFMGLDPRKGKSILEQCKTDEEIKVMHELLEQIRLQDIEASVAGTRTAQGFASP